MTHILNNSKPKILSETKTDVDINAIASVLKKQLKLTSNIEALAIVVAFRNEENNLLTASIKHAFPTAAKTPESKLVLS